MGIFWDHYQALRAKYGEPRVMVQGNLKREYFEMEDGRVVMFCSPVLPVQMELPFEGGPDEQDAKL